MKQLLVLLFFCFSIISIGQTLPDSDFTNKAEAKNLMVNGVKEGKWIEYLDLYGNVTTDTITSYTLGSTDTTFETEIIKENGLSVCHPIGSFYRLVIYKSGKPFGIERQYYKGGKLRWEVKFINGKQNGVAKRYDKDGKLRTESPFINGKLNGVMKDYYKSGKIEEETPYKDNKRNGVAVSYYEDDTIESEVPFKNDNFNGLQKIYYENGKLKEKDTFKNGKHLETKNYDENGNEIKQ